MTPDNTYLIWCLILYYAIGAIIFCVKFGLENTDEILPKWMMLWPFLAFKRGERQ